MNMLGNLVDGGIRAYHTLVSAFSAARQRSALSVRRPQSSSMGTTLITAFSAVVARSRPQPSPMDKSLFVQINDPREIAKRDAIIAAFHAHATAQPSSSQDVEKMSADAYQATAQLLEQAGYLSAFDYERPGSFGPELSRCIESVLYDQMHPSLRLETLKCIGANMAKMQKQSSIYELIDVLSRNALTDTDPACRLASLNGLVNLALSNTEISADCGLHNRNFCHRHQLTLRDRETGEILSLNDEGRKKWEHSTYLDRIAAILEKISAADSSPDIRHEAARMRDAILPQVGRKASTPSVAAPNMP